jgi:hypothetical protein
MNLSPRSPRSEQSISENISSSSTNYPSDFEQPTPRKGNTEIILETGKVGKSILTSIGKMLTKFNKSHLYCQEQAPIGYEWNGDVDNYDHKKIIKSTTTTENKAPVGSMFRKINKVFIS